MNKQKLRQRILDISYKHKLSHLGSCLTALDIKVDMYQKIKPEDKFVLSQGHAGLALYVVLEDLYEDFNAEEYLIKAGIHPDRLLDSRIHCSTGSLGQGLPIALGIAQANPDIEVYCLISDGDLAEGSIWESLYYLSKNRVKNLNIYVNDNGYTGYGESNGNLPHMLYALHEDFHYYATINPIPLEGLKGHYQVMDNKLYKQLSKLYDTP